MLFGILSTALLILPTLFAIDYYHTNKSYPVKLGSLQAFTEHPSYEIGTSIPIFIHSITDFSGTLFHLQDKLVPANISVAANKNVQDSIYDPNSGFSWKPTLNIESKGLASGYYVLKLKNESRSFDLAFILTPVSPKKISIVSSTNTWQAYNHFGGRSNYKDQGTFLHQFRRLCRYVGLNVYNVILPYRRPYLKYQTRLPLTTKANDLHSTKDVLKTEWPLVHFLHERAAEYGTYSDRDFAFNSHILKSQLIIFQSHSEYWSNEMINRLREYLDGGGKVIFLSGNNLYRKINYEDSGIRITDQKTNAEAVRALIGTYYSRRGYKTYAPFEVMIPEHWVFKGAQLSAGDTFAQYSSTKGSGGSGMEMDITGTGSHGFVVLAKGLNGNDPAELGIKEYEKGGWVFNASSVVFAGCLSHDKTVDQMIDNLIKDALK